MSLNFTDYLKKIVGQTQGTKTVKAEFLNRVEKGNVTRDENPLIHFCVYFAGFDPKKREVFIGHHIKSGLWLFNGGHIDRGEMPIDTLVREINEEWGQGCQQTSYPDPSLLTITPIEHPEKQICEVHFDIWYFIPLDKHTFSPDEKLLATEFHVWGWKTIAEAKTLATDNNTLIAINEIEKLFSPPRRWAWRRARKRAKER